VTLDLGTPHQIDPTESPDPHPDPAAHPALDFPVQDEQPAGTGGLDRIVFGVTAALARISRGRTIRQFVSGVLLVPSLVSLVWFCIFGGAAIHLQETGTDIPGAAGVESQLFTTLEAYPWATLTSIVVMVLVAIFFVSGADAASIVMRSLSERGTLEPSRGPWCSGASRPGRWPW
jgi:hypothetical protein